MILGMNLLVFIIVASLVIVALSWCCEWGPEIYREQGVIWKERFQKQKVVLKEKYQQKVHDPEKTMKIKLAKIEAQVKHELQIVFVINKPAGSVHRRHARV